MLKLIEKAHVCERHGQFYKSHGLQHLLIAGLGQAFSCLDPMQCHSHFKSMGWIVNSTSAVEWSNCRCCELKQLSFLIVRRYEVCYEILPSLLKLCIICLRFVSVVFWACWCILQAPFCRNASCLSHTRADSACERLSYIEDSICPLWHDFKGFHFPCTVLPMLSDSPF